MSKIDKLREEFEERLEALEAEGVAGEGEEPSEAVIEAGRALASAISEQLGIEQPVGGGEGGGCGLVQMPREFLESGGVAVFAVVAPPPE